ncbi:unannotated protein [freshwater metagenome]|uniref:Unannotated protein n=1 Tax=freshwater metagenome TaxID=449393 RepID=A0A6J7J6M2_9ZZZZ
MAPNRPTIKDVAALAGVSKSLVSLAMRGSDRVSAESRAAIIEAATQLGYRPNAAARSLADRRSHTLGVVVLDLLNPIYAEIIDGVQGEVRQHGYHTMLVTGNDNPVIEQGEVEKLLEFQVEGLVLIGHRMPAGSLDAIAGDCPAVVISRAERGIAGLDSISNDDVFGARIAVDHLVSLGHQSIAHVTGGINEVAMLRTLGYEQSMANHRLADQTACYDGAFTDEGGYRGAAAALDSGRGHTALFVANDIAAVGALAAVADRGLDVPADISIVGYDGMALAGLRSLSITTIAQPLARIGTEGASLLFLRIGDPTRPPAHIGVEPRLIIRNSSGPCRP